MATKNTVGTSSSMAIVPEGTSKIGNAGRHPDDRGQQTDVHLGGRDAAAPDPVRQPAAEDNARGAKDGDDGAIDRRRRWPPPIRGVR